MAYQQVWKCSGCQKLNTENRTTCGWCHKTVRLNIPEVGVVQQANENNRKYIPDSSIQALADRFAKGEATHADDPFLWNTTRGQESLDNISFIKDRIHHGFLHLLHYQTVLSGADEDDGDDDGAAIMWLGAMLHEAWVRRRKKKAKETPSDGSIPRRTS